MSLIGDGAVGLGADVREEHFVLADGVTSSVMREPGERKISSLMYPQDLLLIEVLVCQSSFRPRIPAHRSSISRTAA